MYKHCLISIAILLLIFGCNKQYAQQTTDWKEFVSNEGKFKVLFPTTPTNVTREVEVNGKKLKYPKVVALLPQMYFSVSSGEVPTEVITDQNKLKSYYDSLRDKSIELSNNNSVREKLLSERDIWLEGKLGRETVVIVEDEIDTFQFYLVETRMFQISAKINSSVKDNPETQRDVKYFLDSFQFVNN